MDLLHIDDDDAIQLGLSEQVLSALVAIRVACLRVSAVRLRPARSRVYPCARELPHELTCLDTSHA